MHHKIISTIKKFDSIVITRHIGPDPDALGAELGLKEIILTAFPNKKVYAVGAPAAKFKYLGILDKLPEDFKFDEALLIILDTPDRKRIDGVDPTVFKDTIKIDHHPFIEKVCNLELIDELSSSTCEIIIDLFMKAKWEINQSAAEKLFTGLIADNNRFLFNHGNESIIKTFDVVKRLLQITNLDVTPIYAKLYMRSVNEMKLQGYISQNMTITDNGVGYIKLMDETIKEFNVDSGSAGNMVNNFNFIDGVLVWLMITEDVKLDLIRINIRSRGPIINTIAEQYNGGGHKYASGARVKTYDEVAKIIEKLDQACKEYNDNLKGGSTDENK